MSVVFVLWVIMLCTSASRKIVAEDVVLPEISQDPRPGHPGQKALTSPLPAVSDAAWTRLVQVLARQGFSHESPKGFYGAFGLGVRRLADLKIMSNPVKIDGVWTGLWVIPKETFLGSPTMQYQALARSLDAYRIVIEKKYPGAVGADIDGQKASLSGLLAAAHMVGSVGLGKWLANPEFRRTFGHVTQSFKDANGIF